MSVNDPIVKDLVRGIKMALGKRKYLNRLEAEAAERQPSLFPKAPNVSAMGYGKENESG